jgi:cell division septation protein DedD
MKKYLSLSVFLFLFIACGSGGIEGFVGEAISITADNPDETADVDYTWILIDQPDGSLINSSDLSPFNDGSKMTFEPDYPGDYTVDVVVSKYGDEISNQSFAFSIIHLSDAEDAAEEIEEDEEEWLNEDLDDEYVEEEELDEDLAEEEFVDDDEYIAEQEENNNPVPVIESPVATPAPKPVVKAKPLPPKRTATIPAKTDRYTIQVVSKKMLKDADQYAERLISQGYDAYIQKVIFEETDEIFYRVRIGSYDNMNAAYETAKSVSKKLGLATWVDFVRKEQKP